VRSVSLALALGAIFLASCSHASGFSSPLPADQAGVKWAGGTGGYTSLYSFAGKPDGVEPSDALLLRNAVFYGTTQAGGENNLGAVFTATESGKESVIYSFGSSATDGNSPDSGLTFVNGVFFGTTVTGGANCAPAGCGTVYKVTPSGNETVIYSFKGGTDGSGPVAGLVDVDGTLYGTTSQGGNGHACCGTLFAVSTSGQERVLYRFKGGERDGEEPLGGLIEIDGMLYGTTQYGGAKHCGTIFASSTSGTERVLYDFKGSPSDGEQPVDGLIASSGKLYGTTSFGGTSTKCPPVGCGTVFEATTSGTERVLYNLEGGSGGSMPLAGLTVLDGALYGTAFSGGYLACSGGVGCGVIFKVTATGGSVLYDFRGGSKSGAYPYAPLTAVDGTLYGTTFGGGASDWGSIFKFVP
jgi:uncharacterized repeat protein (TIGR03803 family)